MNPSDPAGKQAAKYRATAEALERLRARELQAMTEAEARRRMALLTVAAPPWRPRPDWSGLVEQQRLFHARNPR